MILKVSQLVAGYHGVPVVDGIDVTCDRGQVVSILGASGSGKTTILAAMAGLMQPLSGSCFIGDVPSVQARRERQIGLVFQAPTLMPWLTVSQNVELAIRLGEAPTNRRSNASIVTERSHDALRRAHIETAANKYPDELSGGMQARVALARAIVNRPPLLLLDEAFAALDDIVKEKLFLEVQELQSTLAMASIVVTHNIADAVLMSDEVLVLRSTGETNVSRVVHRERISHCRPRSWNSLSDPGITSAIERIVYALRTPYHV